MCDHCGCREFAPIAELTAEHVEILRLAWEVTEAAEQDSAGASHAELLELLGTHARKEETGLYPLLVELGLLTQQHSDELAVEHDEIHGALAGGHYGRNEYYALAAHVEEEEIELFSAAGFGFEEPEWERIEAAHRAAELHRVPELEGES